MAPVGRDRGPVLRRARRPPPCGRRGGAGPGGRARARAWKAPASTPSWSRRWSVATSSRATPRVPRSSPRTCSPTRSSWATRALARPSTGTRACWPIAAATSTRPLPGRSGRSRCSPTRTTSATSPGRGWPSPGCCCARSRRRWSGRSACCVTPRSSLQDHGTATDRAYAHTELSRALLMQGDPEEALAEATEAAALLSAGPRIESVTGAARGRRRLDGHR